MKKKKILVILVIAVLLIAAVLWYGSPKVTLFFENGPYEILWQKGFDSYGGRMYVYESNGQCGAAMFWKDGLRWKWLMDTGTEEIAMINFTFPNKDDWTEIGNHCLIVSSDAYLREYITGYTSEDDLSDLEIIKDTIKTEAGESMILYGFAPQGEIDAGALVLKSLTE